MKNEDQTRVAAGLRGVTQKRVQRSVNSTEAEADWILVEEPLEIRWAGDALATTMRTPGDDAALALGFLHSEGLISQPSDVGTVRHCGRPGSAGYENVIDVLPGPGTAIDVERWSAARRGTLTTSACGVCGRQTIDDLLACVNEVRSNVVVAYDTVSAVGNVLAKGQARFSMTGGAHAAALLCADGGLLGLSEDVGRHNAVDKVIGRARYLSSSETVAPAILAVSGRVSFEIIQKAAMGRIPVVSGIGAASSLAIELAERVGVTLCAFARGGRANVYTHFERLRES